jgi:hypothetical protein
VGVALTGDRTSTAATTGQSGHHTVANRGTSLPPDRVVIVHHARHVGSVERLPFTTRGDRSSTGCAGGGVDRRGHDGGTGAGCATAGHGERRRSATGEVTVAAPDALPHLGGRRQDQVGARSGTRVGARVSTSSNPDCRGHPLGDSSQLSTLDRVRRRGPPGAARARPPPRRRGEHHLEPVDGGGHALVTTTGWSRCCARPMRTTRSSATPELAGGLDPQPRQPHHRQPRTGPVARATSNSATVGAAGPTHATVRPRTSPPSGSTPARGSPTGSNRSRSAGPPAPGRSPGSEVTEREFPSAPPYRSTNVSSRRRSPPSDIPSSTGDPPSRPRRSGPGDQAPSGAGGVRPRRSGRRGRR